MNEKGRRGALTVSHCADGQRRYPGETVTFYTRVDVVEPLPGFALRITLPVGLTLEDYRLLRAGPRNGVGEAAPRPSEATTDAKQSLPLITWDEGRNHLNWRVEAECAAEDRYEYQTVARVNPTSEDTVLESRAVVSAEAEGQLSWRDEETAAVAVLAKGAYLQYLPAVYEDDALMGRFLMLFESFWAPIERQIDSLPFYFDPSMTPPEFLPWLASWIDLVLDEQWPEARRRQLLRSAVPLYRKRGTQKGLAAYLEIYAGTTPEVVEHRAQNFVLGPAGQLGQGIALGTANVPHTFTVRLRLPPAEVHPGSVEPSPSGIGHPPDTGGQREGNRLESGSPQELARQRKIEAIINAQKPAHTRFTLHLEIDAELATPYTREKT
jgi:phage tail-like protein